MISTSAIIGTGLKKCIPTILSGRLVAAASLVIDREEVFVAMIVSGRSTASTPWRILIFTDSFSVAASITRSAFARSATFVVEEICFSVWTFSSAVATPFLINRSREFEIVTTPFSSAALETSCKITLNPFAEKACAMPLPMVPAPITPMVLIAINKLL